VLLAVHLQSQVHGFDLSAFQLVPSACWVPLVFVPLALTLSGPMPSDAWGQGWSGVRRVFWPCALCGGVGAPCCRTLAGGLHKHLAAVFGSLLWCFAACEGPLVGLPCRGHLDPRATSPCLSFGSSVGAVCLARGTIWWLALSFFHS